MEVYIDVIPLDKSPIGPKISVFYSPEHDVAVAIRMSLLGDRKMPLSQHNILRVRKMHQGGKLDRFECDDESVRRLFEVEQQYFRALQNPDISQGLSDLERLVRKPLYDMLKEVGLITTLQKTI